MGTGQGVMFVEQLPGRRRWRQAGRLLAVLTVGITGAALGLLLAGGQRTDAGPFTVELSLQPTGTGETVIALPPLGQLTLDTHIGPLTLDVAVVELRERATRRLVNNPAELASLGDQVRDDLNSALLTLVLRTFAVSIAGAVGLGYLVFRARRESALAGAASVAVLLASSGLAVATFNERALSEPQYTGLLASAPEAVGSVREVVNRVDEYSQALGRLVGNLSQLYDTAAGLSTFTPADDTIAILSVSDLHLSPSAYEIIPPVIEQFGVDVVVDAGDSTDFGTAAEASYVSAISSLDVPYVWVRGNHDSAVVQAAVARQPNAVVLDDRETQTVAGLVFMGDGDPRFTPDKTTGDDDAGVEVLLRQGWLLRAAAADLAEPPDVIVVHEPPAARQLFGAAPLVLAGHAHERIAERQDGTLLLIQGSTGGAGLRGLEGEEPTPITMSVLYLEPVTGRVLARDDITLGGLGLSSAQITRTVAPPVGQP